MSGCFYKIPFENCPFYNKSLYTEKSFIKKHFVLNHDFAELVQFALDKGLIQDPIRYHNRNFVLNRVVDFCKVSE